jgi:hypothetical protein
LKWLWRREATTHFVAWREPSSLLLCLIFLSVHRVVVFLLQMQRFILAVLVLLSATACLGFTPDAAFKRSQVNLSFGNSDQKNVFVYTQSTNDKRKRSAFVSMTDNLRQSVTGPPSFEEYMAVRRRAMLEVKDEAQDNSNDIPAATRL